MLVGLDYDYVLRHVVWPFALSFGLAMLLTFIIRPLSKSWGLLDRPGEHKQHESPTPTLGGVPVFVAFLIGCLASGPLGTPILVLLQAAAVLVITGVCDDIWGVRAKIKLGVLFLGTAWLWKFGLHLNAFGWGGGLALILTFLWIGLVSSAFNGVDNADGAAGGLAAISGLSTFAISWVTWQHDLAVISLVLAAACLGFLVFNFPWPRATIFLGDGGSLFLGFGLGGLTVVGHWTNFGWKSAVVALLLVFVPLFDFLFILISRGLDGRYRNLEDPIRMCGRDHSSHRLRHLGLSSLQVLAVLYGAGILSGGLALLIVLRPYVLTPLTAGLGVLVVLGMGFALKSTGLPPGAFPEAAN